MELVELVIIKLLRRSANAATAQEALTLAQAANQAAQAMSTIVGAQTLAGK